ncbi:hypothetical protein CPB84DRAFT_1768628 [Gymnopilus junonius]|uniref:Uncharacterized protein n=1 Tax=Gymnopilus junonius TaxID=109634 RepID=A0A9P5NSN6_GYMJU|nr:hypothetical protein CPB84DRAFT_1768628 [Gymnopilus junonius]
MQPESLYTDLAHGTEKIFDFTHDSRISSTVVFSKLKKLSLAFDPIVNSSAESSAIILNGASSTLMNLTLYFQGRGAYFLLLTLKIISVTVSSIMTTSSILPEALQHLQISFTTDFMKDLLKRDSSVTFTDVQRNVCGIDNFFCQSKFSQLKSLIFLIGVPPTSICGNLPIDLVQWCRLLLFNAFSGIQVLKSRKFDIVISEQMWLSTFLE